MPGVLSVLCPLQVPRQSENSGSAPNAGEGSSTAGAGDSSEGARIERAVRSVKHRSILQREGEVKSSSSILAADFALDLVFCVDNTGR